MKNTDKLLGIAMVLTTSVLTGCGSAPDGNPVQPFAADPEVLTDATQAELRAQSITRGTVRGTTPVLEAGTAAFAVDVEMPSGSLAVVTLEAATANLMKLESVQVRGIDTLEPGDGFLSLAGAVDIVRRQVAGTVVGWWLGAGDNGRWRYRIDLLEGAAFHRIHLDAQTGERDDDRREDRDGGVGEDNGGDGGPDGGDDRDGGDGGPDGGDDRDGDGGLRDACERNHANDDFDGGASFDDLPESTVTAAVTILPGEIIKVEREREDGRAAWKLLIRTESTAIVEMRLFACTDELYRAEDDNGPFDYDLRPKPGYASLQEAVQTARGPYSGRLERWRLRERDNRLTYEIRIETTNDRIDAEVDAATGLLVSSD